VVGQGGEGGGPHHWWGRAIGVRSWAGVGMRRENWRGAGVDLGWGVWGFAICVEAINAI
jgi:hypothetical protein